MLIKIPKFKITIVVLMRVGFPDKKVQIQSRCWFFSKNILVIWKLNVKSTGIHVTLKFTFICWMSGLSGFLTSKKNISKIIFHPRSLNHFLNNLRSRIIWEVQPNFKIHFIFVIVSMKIKLIKSEISSYWFIVFPIVKFGKGLTKNLKLTPTLLKTRL